jgi:ketosteroid isomerase-like protein
MSIGCPINQMSNKKMHMAKRFEQTAEFATAGMLDRRAALARVAELILAAGTGAVMATRAAAAATDPNDALTLARRWIESLNRRDEADLSAILSDNFLYSGMVKNPPELASRYDKAKFLGIVKSTAGAGWKKPVIMTVKSAFGAGDRAVIEAEGYSELDDGYVYANVYCFNFWTEGGKIKAIHDYCCTHTVVLLGQHMRDTAKKTKAS